MIIQHNVAALNAYRNKTNNSKGIAKNLEKLSSGYMINRAGDDAAGLAISEKMRAQIAGLEQGEKNISDGISLVQTAEGAMAEMCDMMHRLTSLTIQSYNGTYSRSDREMMQQEVEQILKEMDRIAESTNFNGIPLLQGNPTTEVVVEEGKTYTQIVKQHIVKELPAWLKSGVDEKLEIDGSRTEQQDTSGLMFRITDKDRLLGEYRGPDQGDIVKDGVTYKHAGEWSTGTIGNNPSAEISFKGLVADSNSAEELYDNLFNLIGCSIGVPCGTCDDTLYSIGFSGEVDGFKGVPGYFVGTEISAGGELNLSDWKVFTNDKGAKVNCFDYVKELIQKQYNDTASSGTEKRAEVKTIAGEIASALRDKVQQAMSNVTEMQDHFDRSTLSNTDPYALIVYDYREISSAAAVVKTSCNAILDVPVDFFKEGETVMAEAPIEIVCSSYPDDIIPIDLPDVSVDILGLSGYNVARYDEKLHYSREYQAELEAWEQSATYNTVKKTITTTSIKKLTPAKYVDTYDANGESIRICIKEAEYQTETKPIEVTYREKVYNTPKPVPGAGDTWYREGHVRENIKRLEDALAKIVSYRGSLGAAQNRLEHALNATSNYNENLTASESRIRDVDMAKEMMAFTKNNIISEAASAMLAQANTIPQGVLQLLQ